VSFVFCLASYFFTTGPVLGMIACSVSPFQFFGELSIVDTSTHSSALRELLSSPGASNLSSQLWRDRAQLCELAVREWERRVRSAVKVRGRYFSNISDGEQIVTVDGVFA